jgi:glycerol-3-phosphate acyltransferase PlsY
MSPDPNLFLAIGIAYIIGSVPTGLWLGLTVHGVDIRQHGSKNIGATNTLRTLGVKSGIAALIADIGKGYAAVSIATFFSPWPHAPLACGVAAILGHSFSVFLRLRGGKGVATGAGVFLALAPTPTLIAAAVFLALTAVTRLVSAGSLSGAIVLAIAIFFFPQSMPVRIAMLVVAALIIVKHRTNIARILKGTEGRLGEPDKED